MKKISPKFIGIGGAHSGLGTITKLLEAHPGVKGPLQCTHFFNTDDYVKKGISSYVEALSLASKKPFSGECCADYLRSPQVASRISQHYPDTKLFVIVRNPIDRAVSEYQQAIVTGKIGRHVSCAQYLTNHPSAQTDGFYGKHLNAFFSIYSPLQLYVILYEDLDAEPLKTIQKLYDFLELDKEFVPKRLAAFAPPPEEPKHRGRISRLIHFIIKQVKKLHHKKVLGPLLPKKNQIEKYLNERELLIFKKTFAADAAQLSNFLHRDMVVMWGLGTDSTE